MNANSSSLSLTRPERRDEVRRLYFRCKPPMQRTAETLGVSRDAIWHNVRRPNGCPPPHAGATKQAVSPAEYSTPHCEIRIPLTFCNRLQQTCNKMKQVATALMAHNHTQPLPPLMVAIQHRSRFVKRVSERVYIKPEAVSDRALPRHRL